MCLVLSLPPAAIDEVEIVHIFQPVFLQYLLLDIFAVVSDYQQVDHPGCFGGFSPAVLVVDDIPSEPFKCLVHLSLRFEDAAAAVDRKLLEESFFLSFKGFPVRYCCCYSTGGEVVGSESGILSSAATTTTAAAAASGSSGFGRDLI